MTERSEQTERSADRAQRGSVTTSLAVSPRQLWRAARTPLLIGLAVVLAGAAAVAFATPTKEGLLDPDAVDGTGSRAVAALLRDQGVDVRLTRSAAEVRAADPATTVVVPFPTYQTSGSLAAVHDTRADVVLIEPTDEIGAVTGAIDITALSDDAQPRDPGCALPAAVAAGRVDLGGLLYRPTVDRAVSCYPGDPGALLVQATEADRTVTAIGDHRLFTNDHLADEGNAALALGLLGGQPRLLWYLPSQADLDDGVEPHDLGDLIPPWVPWGAAQLGVAAVLAALWRGRRLGPVVREPLPAVVPASEAVEGRARLYRRVGARAHAADTVRGATRARLLPLLGLPVTARPAELVGAVAARTGRSGPEVEALLYGPAPNDDVALVALARALDACEGEVRRS